MGVSADGRRVIMVTVDGRRATSHGGTLTEMAELLVELGAFRGINLDGGGSTTMVVMAEGGVVNRPSRGWEREVLNHIGVIAPAPVRPVAATQQVTATPAQVEQAAQRTRANRPAATPDNVAAGEGTGFRGWLRARLGGLSAVERLHLGRHREVVVPALFVAGVLATLSVVLWVVSRIRRARARNATAPRSLGPATPTQRASTP